MNNWEVMPYYMLHQVHHSGLGETFEVQHYVSIMFEFLAGEKKVTLTKLSKTHSALNFLGQLDNETQSHNEELPSPHTINSLLNLLNFFLS